MCYNAFAAKPADCFAPIKALEGNMKYTNLIWDWDGTLYNSYPTMLQSFYEVLSGHGFNFSKERLLMEMKKEVKGFLKEICRFSELDVENLYKEYQKYSNKYENEQSLKPFSGLMPVLERLKALGCRHYVFTHRDNKAREICRSQGYEGLFSGWLTREDEGFMRKPSGEGLRYLMKKYSLDPKACLMIGDREIDMASAKNAGIRGLLFEPDFFAMTSSDSPKTAEELFEKLVSDF